MVVKFICIVVWLLFNFIVTEMKEDSAHSSNINGWKENLYASRSDTLISIFNIYFTSLYRQLQFINSFKYLEMEFHR